MPRDASRVKHWPLFPIAGYRRVDVILTDPSWATDRYGPRPPLWLRRMHAAPDAVRARCEAALTDAQRVARSHGHELTPDEADYYVTTEAYARTLFEMDRDVWPGWAERESLQDHRQYRQEVKEEIHTFTGRMSRTVHRRSRERRPLPPCPF